MTSLMVHIFAAGALLVLGFLSMGMATMLRNYNPCFGAAGFLIAGLCALMALFVVVLYVRDRWRARKP